MAVRAGRHLAAAVRVAHAASGTMTADWVVGHLDVVKLLGGSSKPGRFSRVRTTLRATRILIVYGVLSVSVLSFGDNHLQLMCRQKLE